MSDDESKNPDQPTTSSSKEYRPRQQSSSTTRNPDKTTTRSTKAHQPRDQSAGSRKIEKNSASGTPKRSREQKPHEDSHQAKKTNVSVAEPKDDEFQEPDWNDKGHSPTDLEIIELPDNQPDAQPDQQQPPSSSSSSPSPPPEDPPRKKKADLQPNQQYGYGYGPPATVMKQTVIPSPPLQEVPMNLIPA